jgi:hypothetical protein
LVTTVIGSPLPTAEAKIAGQSGCRNGSPPNIRIIGRKEATESRKPMALPVSITALGRSTFISVVMGQ